jgi:hypothetical protein
MVGRRRGAAGDARRRQRGAALMRLDSLLRRFAVALLALAAAVGAEAAGVVNPGYYVVTVYDDPGVVTLDFRYWTVQPDAGNLTILWPEAGLGWNVNGRWYTELFASWISSSKFATHLQTLNWQNDVLLTQGQYPFDLAVHTQLVRPQNPASGYALEIGPVFQTDIDRTQLNLNLFFQRGFHSLAGPTELSYQWQLRYRWNRWLHFGAQGFGELGPWTTGCRRTSSRIVPARPSSARCRSGRARSTGRRPTSPARSTPGAATCSRCGSSTTSRSASCRRCAGSGRTPPRSGAGSPRGCESRNAPRG